MRKLVDFSTYQKVRNLSFNDFNRWVQSLYKSGVQDGVDLTMQDCEAALTEDRLFEIMLSVNGIGKNRAQQVIDIILSEGDSYGIKTG